MSERKIIYLETYIFASGGKAESFSGLRTFNQRDGLHTPSKTFNNESSHSTFYYLTAPSALGLRLSVSMILSQSLRVSLDCRAVEKWIGLMEGPFRTFVGTIFTEFS